MYFASGNIADMKLGELNIGPAREEDIPARKVGELVIVQLDLQQIPLLVMLSRRQSFK